MPKKVLITGATGFLGKAILEKLVKNNFIIFVLLREDSNLKNISELLPFCQCIYYKTLRSRKLVNDLKNAKDADFFIHCAWKGVINSDRDQSSQITYNIPLAIDSVLLANNLKCKKWIGIGSQAEYGIVNEIANEDFTSVNPNSAYGKAKVACYWSISALCQLYGIEMIWCRVFSLYGKNDNPNYLIPYVINECIKGNSPKLTKCEQKWDYLHVYDCAEAILALAKSKASGIFNIGSGNPVILMDIVEHIKQVINADLIIKYGEREYSTSQIMHLEADINKIKKITKWKPKIDLKEGLSQTIQFYLKKHFP